MSEEEASQEKALEEQQKQEDAHEAGKTVVKDGAKLAGEYFAPGVGGAVVDAVASTKVGQKVLDAASDVVNSIPGASDALAKAKPAVDQADQALNVASMANPASAGASAASSATSSAASGAEAAGAAAKANTASNADTVSNIPETRPKPNSTNVEIKSNMPLHGNNLRQKGNSLYDSDDDSPEEPEEDSSTPEEEENEYQEETIPDNEEEPKKKKGIIRKTIDFITLAPLIAIGIPFVLLLIVILFLFSGDNSGIMGIGGLTYYDTACNQVTVVDAEHEGENGFSVNGTYDLDTYIAGVVVAEVGGFHNEEIFKAFAVAARTYALRYFESSGTCTIAGNTTKQSFMSVQLAQSKGHNMDVVLDAVKATMGIVITDKNGNLASTEYDAFCMDHTDANYYYLRQKNQALDRTWVENNVPSGYRSGVCAGGHGRGMSQYGALYLAMQQGKNYQDILSYYYNDIQFQTILKSSASTNYTIATSAGANDQIHVPLSTFLQSKGTTADSFNMQMMEAVKSAGPGTRDGVVAAATSLIGTLYEQYGGRLPYTLSGGHGGAIYNTSGQNINRNYASFYGIDPLWGSEIRNASGGRFTYPYHGSLVPFYYYGPDCSGFVSWAMKTGGFNAQVSTSQADWGPKHYMNGSFKGQPGDLIWHTGHIMMIVGVDEDARLYYIAHASSGSQGVKINPVPFNWKDNYIIDMTEWYAKNVTTNDPATYETLFQEGKLT